MGQAAAEVTGLRTELAELHTTILELAEVDWDSTVGSPFDEAVQAFLAHAPRRY